MADDYQRGEMNISHQADTFSGFINVSIYSALLTAVPILYLAMVFGTDFGWFNSLIISTIVAVVGGVVLKRGALYWFCVGVLVVVALIASGLVSLFAG